MKDDGNHDPVEQTFACPHLKVVNIKCQARNERVSKTLKLLSTCGVPCEHIRLKLNQSRSYRKLTIFILHALQGFCNLLNCCKSKSKTRDFNLCTLRCLLYFLCGTEMDTDASISRNKDTWIHLNNFNNKL
jgi:hypothetical protein